MSIKKKLIIVILGVVIIVTFFVSAISYLSAKNALERATLMSRNIIAESKEGQVFLYLEKLKDRTTDFSSDGFIRDSLVTISAQDSIDAIEKLNVHLIKNKKSLDEDILAIEVLDLNGEIVASTDSQRIGLDQHKEKYFIAGKRELYVQDIREEPDETYHLNVSVPLTHREKPTEVIGVIVNHYNAKAISSLLSGEKILEMGAKTQLAEVGETGETYIVNKDKFMITGSIFIRKAIFNVKVDTFPVKKCFEDNEEVKGVWLNYCGVPVAGVSMCMTVGDFTWVLISEQGIAEIFLPIYNLRKLLFIIGTITLFLVVLVVLSIAQSISKPIHILHKGTERIGSGDLDYRIRINTKDEIGQLARSFNRMSGALRRDITELKKAEEHIEHLNSVLKAIRNVNQLIIVEKDRDSLLQKVCDVLIETRGYDAAWLGFLRDSKTFITIKGSGFMEDLSRFREHLIGGEYPPCFKNAFAQKDTFMLVDKSIECGDCFFKNAHTDKEVAIMRVEHAGRLFGLLAISFTPGITVDEEEKGLLKEVVGDIAFALHGMKQEDTRKKAEEALRTSEALLTEIGRIAKVGGWEIDAKTLEVSLTEETYRIYEIPLGTKPPLEEAIDFFHPDDRPKLETAIQRALEHSEPFDMELRFITAKGKHLWTHAICKPITVDGKTVKLTGTFQDITVRKKLENKLRNYTKDLEKGVEERTKELVVVNKHLEKADRAKSEFLSNMSHELRTPLNAIIGFSEILKDESFGSLNEKQKEYISDVWRSGKHLLSLINDILDLSKVEAGKVELELSDFDLAATIESNLFMVREQAIKHNIQIIKNIKDDIGTIRADERKVKQIMFNLLSNAVKFTPDGGKIGVEAKKTEDGGILITVWDTGIGIEEKDKDKVFKEFEQIDSSYSRQYAGTGLGMPLTKKLVDLHGGKIWVESEGKDKGSRFSFSLPMDSTQQILHARIENKIAEAKKGDKTLSVFVININNYSEIEEKCGRKEIEEVVMDVLRACKQIVKSEDFAIRKSNNEIIVLAGVSKKVAHRVNARLKEAIKSTIFRLKKEEVDIDINFSCGFSAFPEDGSSSKDLLEKAAQNLISEKEERLKKNIMIVDEEPEFISALERLLRKAGFTNLTEITDSSEALEKIKASIPDLIILDMETVRGSGYEVISGLKENKETKDIPIIILSGNEEEVSKLRKYTGEKAIRILSKPFNVEQVQRLVKYLL